MNTEVITSTSSKGVKVQVIKSSVKGETNDCTVRALAAATGSSYQEAHDYAAEAWNRKNGKGVSRGTMIPDMLTNNPLGCVFTSIGDKESESEWEGKKLKIKEPKTYYNNGGKVVERTMTVKTLLERYPEGTFYVFVKGHVFTIKDGVVVGNVSDAEKLRTRLKFVFKVTKESVKKRENSR